MRILCLTDFPVRSGKWLWDYLTDVDDEVEYFAVPPVKDQYAKWGKLITYYPAYIRFGIKVARSLSRNKYDVIMAWEGKNGFPYAVIRKILGMKQPPFVIATFIYRGILRHFPALARFGMSSVNHICVTNQFEVVDYRQRFGYTEQQVSYIPLGWYRVGKENVLDKPLTNEHYILASGRSYRDYATFIEAIRGLDVPVKLIARSFNLRSIKIPDNVTYIDLLPSHEFWRYLRNCEFLVVPLCHVPHAAGDGHIIQGMSAGKAIVATRACSAETYIRDGKTGLLVPPSDPDSLREAILQLWNNPLLAQGMGEQGYFEFENNYTMEIFARRVHEMLWRVVYQ